MTSPDAVDILLETLGRRGVLGRITYLELGEFKAHLVPAPPALSGSKLDEQAAAKELEERILYGSNGG